MVVKIGGIEIDKSSDVNDIEQLQIGLDSLGVETKTGLITWVSELSLIERIEFSKIVGSWGWDTFLSLITFGIF